MRTEGLTGTNNSKTAIFSILRTFQKYNGGMCIQEINQENKKERKEKEQSGELYISWHGVINKLILLSNNTNNKVQKFLDHKYIFLHVPTTSAIFRDTILILQ
jgi:hypothetical protein